MDSIRMGAGSDVTEYRVVERGGCTLIYGALSLTASGRIFSGFPEGAVVDTDLARMTEATFAIGLPEDTERLRRTIADDVLARIQIAFSQTGLSDTAIRWLALGEHGASSQAMFLALTGIAPPSHTRVDSTAYPHDPSDLRRCRLLLEAVPELQADLGRMREVSPVWAQLIDCWDDLCATMDAECPQWRNGGGPAPKTYQSLKAAYSGVGAVRP